MAGSPFRTVWFYNSISGSVISEPAIGDTIQAHLPGWHGPFGSKQDALNYYSQNKAAHPGWKAPTGLAGAVGNTVGAAAGAAAGLTGIDAIGGFFSRLTDPHTWLRLAEGIVGVAFLIIGLNALLHNPAGKIANSVPKVVPV